MTESIWSRSVTIARRAPLDGDITVDAAVIGAGMTGVLTAYYLQEQGVRVAVLEADRIAGGQTKNTTAKITSQHGLIYDKLIRDYGKARAELYAAAHQGAVAAYEAVVEKHGIDCHFKRLPSYLYTTWDGEVLLREAHAAAELGLPAHFEAAADVPWETAGAVCFGNQAQFHPLEFVKALSEKLRIYEQTKVLSVKGNTVLTDRGRVTAEHIIFATHYPFVNVPGFYFARQHQDRSYVIAYENAKQPDGMYYSTEPSGLSVRSYENLLLLGSGAHRTGENRAGGSYEMIQRAAEQYFPGARESARWSAQDCMTHDGLPFIGRYSVWKPHWYVATGFKKWGMTSAMLSAQIITDLICDTENPYEKLFAPQRLRMSGVGGFIADMGKSTKGLARGLFRCREHGERGHRCRHMGCGLTWNPDEQSWDCPCHGSRYDKEGRLLDDPAQTDVKDRKL